MRARLAQIALVIFLVVSLVAVADVSTGSSDLPVIQVVPKISTGAPGKSFTVDITIAGVTWANTHDCGVYGWQFYMSFNPDVLNATSVMEGPWLKSTGEETLFTKSIVNLEGWLIATNFLIEFPEKGVVGSGTLANVTFDVLAIGACPLDIYGTKLRSYDGTNPLVVDHAPPVDGFFSNVHDLAITSVTPSDTQVDVGNTIDIDVIVANEGDFNEAFDVTTYWNIGSSAWRDVIETKTGEYLENGTSTSPPLTFTWDTTGFWAGIYTISAEVSVVAGEANTTNNKRIDGQVTVNVPGAPLANFTYFPKIPSVDEPVAFNSTSYDSDGSIDSWKWDFDGDRVFDASDENGTYTYTEAGTYTAILFVTDDEGKEAFSYELIQVVTNPVANFTYSPTEVLVRQPVNFNSTSYDSDGTVVEWKWDFDGDGVFDAFDENVIHTYTENRTYTVNLTVTDNDGLTDSIAKNVTVSLKHDVAVKSVSTSLGTYYAGATIGIKVEIRNKGTETETFNVTAYYDNTFIQTLPVVDLAPADQAPNNMKSITITWVGTSTKDVPAGKYNITAEVILDADEDLTNNKNSTIIEITVVDVAVTNVEASPTLVLAGGLLNVTVVVENKGTGLANPLIIIELTNAAGHTEELASNSHIVIENATEKIVFFRNLNATQLNFSPGIYNLSAKVTLIGEPSAVQGDNYFPYGEITLGASLISISTTPEDITLGSSTTINGSITPLRRNVPVTIHYRVSGSDTWGILENVTTDDNGIYSYDWTPKATGTYDVKASWEGDNNALPSESETVILIVNPATPILLYALAVIAAATAIVVVAIYFLKIRKPKSA